MFNVHDKEANLNARYCKLQRVRYNYEKAANKGRVMRCDTNLTLRNCFNLKISDIKLISIF